MRQSLTDMRKEWAKGDAIRDQGLTVPAGIELCKDICYSEEQGLLLDVYYPEGTAAPLPTVISIHGGGWFYGDKELYSHYCMRLAPRGFAVVNFNYRLAPEHRYPAALEDCVQVLRWIAIHGKEYHIDADKLFMVGDSAGGQLALQMLTMLSSPEYAALFPFSCPDGIRVLACGLNCGCYYMPFSRIFPPKAMGILFESYLPEDYMPILPQLKPQKYLTKDFPPAFVMSARNDYLKFMAPMLHKQLKKRNVETVLKIYGTKEQKEIGHVFHLNCRSELADLCNDEQCAFFREHLSEKGHPVG